MNPAVMYDDQGRKVVVVAEIENGVIVRPLLDVSYLDDYSEADTIYGALETVDAVYPEAPREIYDVTLSRLRAEVADLTERRDSLHREKQAAEKVYQLTLAKLKAYPALARVEAILDGKMTHCVVENWSGVTVSTIADALKDNDRWEKRPKLLTLFGDAGSNPQWGVNDYRDGSGSNRKIFLFASEGEAAEYARGMIATALADRLTSKWDGSEPRTIEAAKLFRVPVPEALLRAAETVARGKLTAELAKRQAEVGELLAKLAAVGVEEAANA